VKLFSVITLQVLIPWDVHGCGLGHRSRCLHRRSDGGVHDLRGLGLGPHHPYRLLSCGGFAYHGHLYRVHRIRPLVACQSMSMSERLGQYTSTLTDFLGPIRQLLDFLLGQNT
jgi:hypothetical protein